MAPESSSDRSAASRTLREQIASGYRPAALRARFGHKRRLEAAQSLCARAPRKPGWLYDAQREDVRRSLPDEREYDAIQDGIEGGWIAETELAQYFAEKFLIHLAALPSVRRGDDVSYCATVREVAEALEALTVERGLSTTASREVAVREGAQAIVVMQARVTQITRGCAS